MNRIRKGQSRHSDRVTGKDEVVKKRVSLTGEDAGQAFGQIVEVMENNIMTNFMCDILEKIAIKKRFDVEQLYKEMLELVLSSYDDNQVEKRANFMADKIIRGKNIVEL